MREWIAPLIRELKASLAASYGERLRGVYIYGSYARGEAGPESDVDIVVVLDDIASYAAEVDRTGHLVSSLSLRYGVSISRVFVSERAWREGETAFLATVREEAVPA